LLQDVRSVAKKHVMRGEMPARKWDQRRVAALLALVAVLVVVAVGLFELRRGGYLDVFSSEEALRSWVSQFGVWAPIVFCAIQMLQVIISPIPGGVTTLVGGAMFGLWPAFFLSSAAVLVGSLITFGLARAFGRPLVVRLVGPRVTEKYLGAMSSRGRIAFLLMFLLPFFPDDALSAIAGLTRISWGFFALIVAITRPWGLLFSALVGSGMLSVSPVGWAFIATASLGLVAIAMKWGPQLEQRLYDWITRRNPPPSLRIRGKRGAFKTRPYTWVALALVLCLAALAASFAFPSIPLDRSLARWAWRVTLTGGLSGIAVIAVACTLLLTLRQSRPRRDIVKELLVHVLVLGVFLGGGALANEYFLKPAFAVPRPNIELLEETGILELSAKEFYSSLSKDERRIHLAQTLSEQTTESVGLHETVRDHWIHEAGYAFPSGHTFSAALLAAYFLSLGAVSGVRRQKWAWGLLSLYAVCIGWTRVLLGVHRPIDVLAGGAVGIVVGIMASWIAFRFASSLRQ